MAGRTILLSLLISQLLVISSADIHVSDFLSFLQQLNQISLKINHKCLEDLRSFTQSLNNSEEWALRMVDATAKPQTGILFGNVMQVGNYDECLQIGKSFGNGTVRGKYCTALFQPHPDYGEWVAKIMQKMEGNRFLIEKDQFATKTKQSYGFCVPKDCSHQDLQVLSDILEKQFKSPLHFIFVEDFCDSGEGLPLTPMALFAICVFALFGVIVISSTLYDVLCYQKSGSKRPNLYMAFSIYTNGKRLLSTETSEGTFNCLNGLRVISLMWIVLVHRFSYQFFVPQINTAYTADWKASIENTFITAGSVAVDTFFVISGLLVVYLHMKNREKHIKFSLPMFYVHRIIRLTPSLIMVVLLSTTLLKHLGNGPFWLATDEMFQKPCERSWWATLLYVQNYVHTHDQCVGQAWYLAVDTQMYFLSPLVFLPMARWPKATIITVCILVVLNCCYVFEITLKKKLGSIYFDQDKVQYESLYSPTHVRGTTYLIGMVCGYFVYKTRKNPWVLNKYKVLSLWTVSLLILLGVTLGHVHFFKQTTPLLDNAFFNSLHRVSWAVGTCIIIMLCVNGYGGIINDLLSHKIFTFLIRINYNVYLLHLIIMILLVAQNRTPGYFSNLFNLHLFWGDYIYSIGIAVIWTLAFESPILLIEKVIFGPRKPSAPIIAK